MWLSRTNHGGHSQKPPSGRVHGPAARVGWAESLGGQFLQHASCYPATCIPPLSGPHVPIHPSRWLKTQPEDNNRLNPVPKLSMELAQTTLESVPQWGLPSCAHADSSVDAHRCQCPAHSWPGPPLDPSEFTSWKSEPELPTLQHCSAGLLNTSNAEQIHNLNVVKRQECW